MQTVIDALTTMPQGLLHGGALALLFLAAVTWCADSDARLSARLARAGIDWFEVRCCAAIAVFAAIAVLFLARLLGLV